MGRITDLSIAGLNFRVHTPAPVPLEASFEPFRTDGGEVDWEIMIREVPELQEIPAEQVYKNYLFWVRQNQNGFFRCFPNHFDGKTPYAVTDIHWGSGKVEVTFLPAEADSFKTMDKCFSHVGFEELLIARDRIILHSSAVISDFGGILFSGPSGIGKSTQAKLWEELEGSRLLNGDRPILESSNGRWMAHGSPYAGSSRCHLRESVPVSAIVLLEQGDRCHIRRVNPSEAFRKLYAQTVVNSWNPEYVNKVCDMLFRLIGSVPVYCLRCTPDADAVNLLKEVLEKGEQT